MTSREKRSLLTFFLTIGFCALLLGGNCDGLQVMITNCPTDDVELGSSIDLQIEVSGASAGLLITTTVDSAEVTNENSLGPSITPQETGQVTVDVEASDSAGKTASDSCLFDVICTANAQCNDNDDCTEDTCEGGACMHLRTSQLPECQISPPCVDGEDCDDDDPCTVDECVNMNCEHADADCSALNDPCNVGVCDAETGICLVQPTNDGGPCDDGDACTTNDTCVGGTCVGGSPLDCDDGNACTSDVCNGSACTHQPSTVGTACGDSMDTECDNPDTCDGSGNCQVNNEPDGTGCGAGGQACMAGVCAIPPPMGPVLPTPLCGNFGPACANSGGRDCPVCDPVPSIDVAQRPEYVIEQIQEEQPYCVRDAGTGTMPLRIIVRSSDSNNNGPLTVTLMGSTLTNLNVVAADFIWFSNGTPILSLDATTAEATFLPGTHLIKLTVAAMLDCPNGPSENVQDREILLTVNPDPNTVPLATTGDYFLSPDDPTTTLTGTVFEGNGTESCSWSTPCQVTEDAVQVDNPELCVTDITYDPNLVPPLATFVVQLTVTTGGVQLDPSLIFLKVGCCQTNSDCDDDNPCTDDLCDGICSHLDNSAACDDGEFCNGEDTCSNGNCSAHAGSPCDGPDGDSDCRESCDEGADSCLANDPDGSACPGGTCSKGECGPSCAKECSPRGNECDDNNACTTDECVEGCCVHETLPDNNKCDDGTFCNGPDQCIGGQCSKSSGDPCPGPDDDDDCQESCDEDNDNCLANDPDDSECNDGQGCEFDFCFNGICGAGCGIEFCGDGVAQGREVCDGSDLQGETCVTQGFSGGDLACLRDCTGFDTSGCRP